MLLANLRRRFHYDEDIDTNSFLICRHYCQFQIYTSHQEVLGIAFRCYKRTAGKFLIQKPRAFQTSRVVWLFVDLSDIADLHRAVSENKEK